MRIALLNPNTTEHMTETMLSVARGVAPGDVELVALTAQRGPTAIESHVDEAYASAGVADLVLEHADLDGYVIACASDPGLFAARELVEAPVVGIGEAAYLYACTLGLTFSLITTLARDIPAARVRIATHGLGGRCASVRAAGVPVLETGAANEAGTAAVIEQGRLAVAEDGAEVLVLGCGGMADLPKIVSAELGVPVVDGVAAAVTLVTGLVRCGLRTSKRSAFAWPEPIAYRGMRAPSRLPLER